MKRMKEQLGTLYPLTGGQQLILTAEKIYYLKSSQNIATSMTFDSPIDPEKMLSAMRIELGRNDVAAMRLHKNGRETQFYISALPPEGVDLVDLSKLTSEAFDDYINKLSRTPFPNKRLDTQLYNVFLAKCPDGKYMLYFLVHHIVMDTVGIFIVTSNILKIYEALMNGTDIPPYRGDLIKLYNQDMEQTEAKAEKLERDKTFWKEVELATEPLYNSVNGKNTKCKVFVKGARYGKSTQLVKIRGKQINLSIPKALAERVSQFCGEQNISEQALCLLGLRSHLARENGFVNDVSVYLSIAKRASLLEKRVAITRADVLLYRMNIPNDTTVLEACRYYSTRQLELYKHDSVSVFELTGLYKERFGTPPMYDYPDMYVTYQKYGIDIPLGMKYHVQRYESGISAMPLSLLIVDADGSGDLLCNYEYNTSMVEPKSIYALHEHLLHFLQTAVNEPDMTLEQIMKSSASSLS